MKSCGSSVSLRRLRYRLRRQGLLELDLWLARLVPALDSADPGFLAAVEELLALEVHELSEMMCGRRPVPERLRTRLVSRSRMP